MTLVRHNREVRTPGKGAAADREAKGVTMDRAKILVTDESLGRMVEEVVGAFNRHDLDYVASWHAEGALHHQPNRPEPLRGREEIREDYRRSTWIPFPDFQFELERAFGQSEWLCVQGTLTGTHEGPLEGPEGETIPATGRAIRVPICLVVRVESGKAVEVYEYNDQLGFLTQLGLAP